MTERYSFADDVIAALNNPKRGFYMKGFSPETTQFRRQRQQRISSMRKDMRLATRYVLDDDFVDFAMEASMRADGEELVDQYKFMSPQRSHVDRMERSCSTEDARKGLS